MKRLLLSAMFCILPSAAVWAQAPEMPQPTESHQRLAEDVGTWTGEMKVWMNGPDADPVVLPTKEVVTMMSGGFWSISKFESGPFKGQGQFGFDPVKKKYVGTWIDSTTPFLNVMEGTFDEEKKELVMFYSGLDMASEKVIEKKNITQHLTPDKRRFTMYQKDPKTGKWSVEFIMNYSKIKTAK